EDFLSQRQRCLNRALAVIFGRPIFNARLQNHCGWTMLRLWKWDGEFFAEIAYRYAELFLESHLTFENRPRPGHTGTRQQRRKHAVPGGSRKCDTLPMREF